jgi:nucleotide-binding universal stress UspA family protein
MKDFRSILCPSDFSKSSQQAFHMACAIARDQRARVVVLHVVPKPAPVTGSDRYALGKAEHAEQDLSVYQREMEKKLQGLQDPGGKVSVDQILKQGEPTAVILQTVEQHSCDLIVMGTHGRSEEQRKALGSVAEEVARQARCPVLLLKMPVGESTKGV